MDWCVKRGGVWWNPCLHPAPCSSKRDPKGSSISSQMTEGGRLWGRARIAPDFGGLESPGPIEIAGSTLALPERLLYHEHCLGGEVVIEGPMVEYVEVAVCCPWQVAWQTWALQLVVLAQGLISSWTCCCFLASHWCWCFILFSDLVHTLKSRLMPLRCEPNWLSVLHSVLS